MVLRYLTDESVDTKKETGGIKGHIFSGSYFNNQRHLNSEQKKICKKYNKDAAVFNIYLFIYLLSYVYILFTMHKCVFLYI